MRFWRRNVADEAAPDADTIVPAAEPVSVPAPAPAAPPESEGENAASVVPRTQTSSSGAALMNRATVVRASV